jgi:hypothetical protein
VGCLCGDGVPGALTAASTPASVLVYVRDAVAPSRSQTPSLTPSASQSASSGATPSGTRSGSPSASGTPPVTATPAGTPSAPPTPSPNREVPEWTCTVGGSTAWFTRLEPPGAGSAYASTFFLTHKPSGWPESIAADVLRCPLGAGAPASSSSFGSTKFFQLPLGYPSEGATITLDLNGSTMAYAAYLGRGCPASPAAFGCVAWARLPCFTPECVRASAVTYTFTSEDAATARWYVALTNTDHRVASGGFSWRTEGKFLRDEGEGAGSLALPATPSPAPSDPALAGVADLDGTLYAFGPGAGDATLGRSDDGAASVSLTMPVPAFASVVDAATVSVNGWVALGAAAGLLPPTAPAALPRPPGSAPVIAPFWADADARGGPADAPRLGAVVPNRVYYRVATKAPPGASAGGVSADSVTLDRATRDVRSLFTASEGAFVARTALVATWYAVAPLPATPAAVAGNTFQAAVVSDGVRTFALLRYGPMAWAAGPTRAPSGAVVNASGVAVVDAGTGGGLSLLFGRPPAAAGGAVAAAATLAALRNGSNVGTPGLWAYRVDTASPAPGGCDEGLGVLPEAAVGDGRRLRRLVAPPVDGTPSSYASLSPRAGSQLGGTPVYVAGPCYWGPAVRCRFGGGTVASDAAAAVVVDGRVLSATMAVCAAPFAARAGAVNVSVAVGSGDDGGSGVTWGPWVPVGTFTYVRPDSHALPAVTVRNLGAPSTAAAPPGAPPCAGKLLPGLTGANDTQQLAWYAPADAMDKLKRSTGGSGGGAIRWTVQFWEARFGGGPAVCPGAATGMGVGGGRLPSPAPAAPPVVLTTLWPGAPANASPPAAAWLSPDVPPDEAAFVAPSRYLLRAHLPAPAFDDACLHAVWYRVALGPGAGGEALDAAYAEATMVSGLHLVLGARASAGDFAKVAPALCAAARAAVPPPTTADLAGVRACPLDGRLAAASTSEWRPDPACAATPGALTRVADALAEALPTAWPPGAGAVVPAWVAAAVNATVVASARPRLSAHVQQCLMHQGRTGRGERTAAACFYGTRAAGARGVTARCCYDASGLLITEGCGAGFTLAPGGSTGGAAAVSAVDADWLVASVWHDAAKLVCCAGSGGDGCGAADADCDAFLRERPSTRNGDGGHTQGGAWNDPHWFTLDGAAYTYNGRGPHLLLGLPLDEGGRANAAQTARLLLAGDAAAAGSAWQVWAHLAPLPTGYLAAAGAPTASLNCSGGPTLVAAVAAQARGGPLVEVRSSASGGSAAHLVVTAGGGGAPLELTDAPALTGMWPTGAAVQAPEVLLDGGAVGVSLRGGVVTVAWYDEGVALRVAAVKASGADGGSGNSVVMLQASLSLSPRHAGAASFGLLGRDPADDAAAAAVSPSAWSLPLLRSSDGAAVSPANATERALWAGFGRSWAAAGGFTPFSAAAAVAGGAGGGEEAAEPAFGDELLVAVAAADAAGGNASAQLSAVCGPNSPQRAAAYAACVYDAVCTGDADVARSSAAIGEELAATWAAARPRPVFAPHPRELRARPGARLSYRFLAALPATATGGRVRYALVAGPENATLDSATGELTLPSVSTAAYGALVRVHAFAEAAGASGGTLRLAAVAGAPPSLPSVAEAYIAPPEEEAAGNDGPLSAGAAGGIAAALLAVAAVAVAVVAFRHRRKSPVGHPPVIKQTAPKEAAVSGGGSGFAQANPMHASAGAGGASARHAAPAHKPSLLRRAGSASLRGLAGMGSSLRNLRGHGKDAAGQGSGRKEVFGPVAVHGPTAGEEF